MNSRIKYWLIALSFAVPALSPAHHSAAMFDHEQCTRVSGTVQKLTLSYPHGWVWVQTDDAKKTVWAIELTDPSSLRIQGWGPKAVKKGDSLDVVANPIRDGRKIAVAQAVRLPGGQLISAGGFAKCPVPWSTGQQAASSTSR